MKHLLFSFALALTCATAIGTFTGLIWFWLGAKTAFILTGCVTLLVMLYFLIVSKPFALNKEAER